MGEGRCRGGAGFESGSFFLDLSLFDWLIFRGLNLGSSIGRPAALLAAQWPAGGRKKITPSLYLTIGHNCVNKDFIPCAGHSTSKNIAANPPTSYTRPGIRGISPFNYSHLFQSQHTTLAFTWKPFLQARSQLAVSLTRDGGVNLA